MRELRSLGALARPASAVGTSLKLKFILIVIVMLACTVGIAPWAAIKMHEHQLLEASEKRVRALWEMVRGSIVATCVITGDRASVQSMFEGMPGFYNIDQVRLLDRDGGILFSSIPEERGRTLPRADLERYYGHPEAIRVVEPERGITHSLARPIMSEPSCTGCHGTKERILGILQVGVPLRDTLDQLQTLKRWAWSATLVTLVVITVGIWISLRVLVDGPLQRLLGTMADAAGGDLSARVQSHRGDELGKLGDQLNHMIMKLEAAQHEVARYHRQQLARADRLATIGEMAAGVAHEIRNPLTGISGILTLLARDLAEDDPRRDVTRRGHSLVDRLNKSVDSILRYSRPSSPQLKVTPLNALIDTTVAFLDAEARHAHIKIVRAPCEHSTCFEAPAVIHADPNQMQQVLMNLILNAIQATPAQGTVWVRTCTQPHPDGRRFACILVEDSGKGMTAEEVEKAFHPFFSTKPQGTGLGLPIAKQLIEQHGGHISIESALGRGTSVFIEIPLELEQTAHGS